MASAGTVTINLDANSVKLLRELQKTETRTRRTSNRMAQDFRKSFTRIAKGAAVMATAVAGATAAIVRAQSRQIDELGKTADSIGVTVENMQALRFVADLTGVSSARLTTSMQRMQRSLGEAARRGGSTANALRDIGVEVKDIINLSADQQMEVLAQALSKVENQTIRASIASDLFGRSGLQMLNTLDALAKDGIDGVRAELASLGFALTREGVAKVEAMNDSLTTLGKVSSGVGQQLTVALSGPIAAVAESLTKAAKESEGFESAIQSAVDAGVDNFAKFLRATATVVEAIEGMPQTAQFGLIGLIIFGKKGALIGAAIGSVFDVLNKAAGAAGSEVAKVLQLQKEVELRQQRLDAARAAAQDPGFLDGIGFKIFGTGVDKFESQLEGAKNRLDTALSGLSEESIIKIKELEDGAEATASGIAATMRTIADALDAERTRANFESILPKFEVPTIAEISTDRIVDPDKLREAQAMFDRTRDSIERVEEQMRRTKELMDSGVFDELGLNGNQVLTRLQEQLEKLKEKNVEMSEFAIQAARNIQTSFADFLFDPFERGMKGMLDNFVMTLRRMAAEAASEQILGALFGGLAGSGNPFLAGLGAVFGGARAAGGPVTGGKSYLVGERGPELIVPGASGTVIPNNAMGGINQTINIPLAFPPSLEAFVRNVAGPAGRDAAMQIMRAQGGMI